MPLVNFEFIMEQNGIQNYALINKKNYVLISNKVNNEKMRIFILTDKMTIEESTFDEVDIYYDTYVSKLFAYTSNVNNNSFKNDIMEIEYIRRTNFIKNTNMYLNNYYLKYLIGDLYLTNETDIQIRVNPNLIHKFMFMGKLRELLDALFAKIDPVQIPSVSEYELKILRSNERIINSISKSIKSLENANMVSILEYISNDLKDDFLYNFLTDSRKFKYLLTDLHNKLKIPVDANEIDSVVTYYNNYYENFSSNNELMTYTQNMFDIFYKSRELLKRSNVQLVKKMTNEINRDIKYYYPRLILEIVIYKYVIEKIEHFTKVLGVDSIIHYPSVIIGSYFYQRLEYVYKYIPINTKQQITNMFGPNIEEFNQSFFQHFKYIDEISRLDVILGKCSTFDRYQIALKDLENINMLLMKAFDITKAKGEELQSEIKTKFPNLKFELKDLMRYKPLLAKDQKITELMKQYDTEKYIYDDLNKRSTLLRNDIKECNKVIEFIGRYVQKLIYKGTGLSEKLNGFSLVKQSSFQYNGEYVPNCGERTIMNLINLWIWNNRTQKMDISFLPDTINTDLEHPLIKFYSVYDTLAKQHNSDKAHNAFAYAIAGYKDIKYNRNKYIEIIPDFKNVINLLMKMFKLSGSANLLTIVNSLKNTTIDVRSYTTDNSHYISYEDFGYRFKFGSLHGDIDLLTTGDKSINRYMQFFENGNTNNFLVMYRNQLNLIKILESSQAYVDNPGIYILKTCKIGVDDMTITKNDEPVINIPLVDILIKSSTDKLIEFFLKYVYSEDNDMLHLPIGNSINSPSFLQEFYRFYDRVKANLDSEFKKQLLTSNRIGLTPLDLLALNLGVNDFIRALKYINFNNDDLAKYITNKVKLNNLYIYYLVMYAKDLNIVLYLVRDDFLDIDDISSATLSLSYGSYYREEHSVLQSVPKDFRKSNDRIIEFISKLYQIHEDDFYPEIDKIKELYMRNLKVQIGGLDIFLNGLRPKKYKFVS